MKLIHDGKTKTVYAQSNDRVMIVFKDDVTGTEQGIDPGGNQVVGRIEGKGYASLKQSVYFFKLLAANGIPTHFESVDFQQQAMIARHAKWLGLEFIIRFKAYGSFVRRYGRYVQEGDDLGGLVEITLKDDERGDPLIGEEAIAALGLMSLEQVGQAKSLVLQAARLLQQDLQAKGLELIDIKFECGYVGEKLVIIDDISTDNMRVFQDGESVTPRQLMEYLGIE